MPDTIVLQMSEGLQEVLALAPTGTQAWVEGLPLDWVRTSFAVYCQGKVAFYDGPFEAADVEHARRLCERELKKLMPALRKRHARITNSTFRAKADAAFVAKEDATFLDFAQNAAWLQFRLSQLQQEQV